MVSFGCGQRRRPHRFERARGDGHSGTAVAVTFIQLADTLVSDYDLLSFLDLLLDRSMAVVGADAGGVLLSDGNGKLKPLVSSDETTRMLELFELQSDEGSLHRELPAQ
jgi:hypothetical protein